MRLETILEYEYSLSDGEVEHATRRILKEINDNWNADAVDADLQLVIQETSYRSQGDGMIRDFNFHFDATQSLLDKLEDYPEALI